LSLRSSFLIRPLTEHLSGYELDDKDARTDFAVVHAWLAGSYWSPGISRAKVETGAANSALVIGAFYIKEGVETNGAGIQVGFLRVISDTTRFAYICDVFVDPAHRGKGLAKQMVQFAINHPDLTEVSRWLLATRDAHEVYRTVGFDGLPEPSRWMQFLPPAQKDCQAC